MITECPYCKTKQEAKILDQEYDSVSGIEYTYFECGSCGKTYTHEYDVWYPKS